jgi:all-trans-retinol dehydrogenase (NAD+)
MATVLRGELLVSYENGHTINVTCVYPDFHDTPMIRHSVEALRKGGLPVYPPENVSEAVVEQVLKGRSGKLYIPEGRVYFLSFVRSWPEWFFHAFAGFILRSKGKKRWHVPAELKSK